MHIFLSVSHAILAIAFIYLTIVFFTRWNKINDPIDALKYKVSYFSKLSIIPIIIFIVGLVDDIFYSSASYIWIINFVWLFNFGLNYHIYKKAKKELETGEKNRKLFLKFGDMDAFRKLSYPFMDTKVMDLMSKPNKICELQEAKKKRDKRIDNINKAIT